MRDPRKFKYRFDRLVWHNRWASRFPSQDWTIVGISERWFSHREFEYRVSFFGFEVRIWINRDVIDGKNDD